MGLEKRERRTRSTSSKLEEPGTMDMQSHKTLGKGRAVNKKAKRRFGGESRENGFGESKPSVQA